MVRKSVMFMKLLNGQVSRGCKLRGVPSLKTSQRAAKLPIESSPLTVCSVAEAEKGQKIYDSNPLFQFLFVLYSAGSVSSVMR